MERDEATRATSQTLSTINFLFGIWLIISPYILTYATVQAKWEQTIAGIVVAILAIVRFFAPRMQWASWINFLIGIWMIIAPFATGYSGGVATWNEVIFGILLVIVAFWNAELHPTDLRHGHMAR